MRSLCPACQPRVAVRPATKQVAVPRIALVKPRDVSAAFFKFGGKSNEPKDRRDVDFARPEQRQDYEAEDVEMYFNYMGCLANEGSYDRMEALQKSLEPVDVLLILACQENDTPKVIELLAAGANVNAKNLDGRTAVELATKAETLSVIKEHIAKAEKSVAV